MGYRVKWVEDHLGITRKALRTYENAGLLPPNEPGAYRNYSDDDINRILTIKLLQGIGYTMKEIARMSKDRELDFEASLDAKIGELEKKRTIMEKHLRYAKHIRQIGHFPEKPEEIDFLTEETLEANSIVVWRGGLHSDGEADTKSSGL